MTAEPRGQSQPAADSTRYVVPLSDAQAYDQHGGKAASLARMERAGFAVAPGFVVTAAAFDAFLQHNDLSGAGRLLAGEAVDSVKIERLRDAVQNAPMPATLQAALDDAALQPAADEPLVVRSSAVGEDGARGSFAGQLESVLDVRDGAQLVAAIRRVWASALSARLLAYSRARGVGLNGVAVLVQGQEQPFCSGVLFTRSPDPGDGADTLYVELVAGHPGPLVAGEATPTRIRLDRGGDDMAVVGEAQCDEDTLAAFVTARQGLADAAVALEELFAAPQDIEWALDGDGALILLQSRPITAPAGPSVQRVVWCSANINENFPSPVPVFTYSVVRAGYAHYFHNLARALGVSRRRLDGVRWRLQNTVGTHQGYLYYNLSNIHAFIRAVPFGDHLAGLFNDFVGTPDSADDQSSAPGPRWRRRLREWAARTRMVLTGLYRYLRLERDLRDFEARVRRFANACSREELDRCTNEALLTRLEWFMDIRCNRWTAASLADFFAMAGSGALKRAVTGANATADPYHALLRGLPELVSAQPVRDLWQLAEQIRRSPDLQSLFSAEDPQRILQCLETEPQFAGFHDAFKCYCRRWGFRRSGELLLTVPSFEERPAPLLDILRTYALGDAADPAEQWREQEQRRQALTGEILSRLRRKRPVRWLPWPTAATGFWLLLRATYTAVARRERARMHQALAYTCLRYVVLVIGERLCRSGVLTDAEDVCFLTVSELRAHLGGAAWAPELTGTLAEKRRAHFAALNDQPPPETLYLLPGEQYRPGPRAERQHDRGTDCWHGTGACGGRITGRAVVLRDVSEAACLRKGDILIVRQTDPGWAPVFPIIAGLVVERGGMLSHGAIVAREFGVPAVVGVAGITREIATGSHVELDGDTGDVRLLA
ncbi:PEP/pyruvate-binding domain-containing protein [Arhodomonas sp. AD133]|uniref:PEP/pyruvate-binding domain-containing protein n=1 Tax=Arhodomonas sp. AD133 TaxID=3415009 RepID=UPI003EBA8561